MREMKCVCSLTEHRNKCEFASRVLTISEYFLLRATEATFITLTSRVGLSTNLRKVAQYPKKDPNHRIMGTLMPNLSSHSFDHARTANTIPTC